MSSARLIDSLESRRLFAALTAEVAVALPVAASTSPQEVAVRSDGTIAVVARGLDGALTLSAVSSTGQVVSGPVAVSGQGSATEPVGSARKAIDVDRDGRVSVVYRRGGTVFVQAFSPTLTSLGGEISLGATAPLDVAVSSGGYLIPQASAAALTVARRSFAGADLGSVVVTTITRPQVNERYDFASVAVDTDSTGGFVVGYSASTITINTLTRRLANGTTAESDAFNQFRSGGFFARRFSAAGAPAGNPVQVVRRTSLGDPEIVLAVNAGGAVGFVAGLVNRVAPRPVFVAAQGAFSPVVEQPVSASVQFIPLGFTRGRLALAGRPTTLFSGGLPNGAPALSYSTGSLQVAGSGTGVFVTSVDTRPFTRNGASLIVDLAGTVTTTLRYFTPTGQGLHDPFLLTNNAPTSVGLFAGDLLLGTTDGATQGGTAFSQRLIAPKPVLTLTDVSAGNTAASRPITVRATVRNTGPVLSNGATAFSAVLRRTGQPDIILTAPAARVLRLNPTTGVSRLVLPFRAPGGTAAGSYTLVLTLDPNGALSDTSTADNTVTVPLTLT